MLRLPDLTEFSSHPILSTTFGRDSGDMGYFFMAVSLTVLDDVVTVHFGWPVWVAWSGDILGQGMLVMMAALATMSLANVWANAISRVRHGLATQRAADDADAVALLLELRGEHHV